MDDLTPDAPDCLMTDDAVEAAEFSYSDRAPGDFVMGGPLGFDSNLRGRWFETFAQALSWARTRYGPRLKRVLINNDDRYAFLIRPPTKKD